LVVDAENPSQLLILFFIRSPVPPCYLPVVMASMGNRGAASVARSIPPAAAW